MTNHPHLQDLIDRLIRVAAASDWADGLNPAQRNALAYLGRANRFSRAPSHVAEYLCTTRGTASQTLKSLERKGLISPVKSETDRRSISFRLTPLGQQLCQKGNDLDDALSDLAEPVATALEIGAGELLKSLLARRGLRPFGVCRDCAHYRPGPDQNRCDLLNVALEHKEADLLCHEQVAPSGPSQSIQS